LHLFVDASQEAYAAVIFCRAETKDKIDVSFVQAKARVAPKKPITIPRLELLAATIGTRLMRSTLAALNNQQIEMFYWTDSSTVLAWIQRKTQWATFVWNRIIEIHKLSNPNSWKHVPGNMNPADLPSRGCTQSFSVESGVNDKGMVKGFATFHTRFHVNLCVFFFNNPPAGEGAEHTASTHILYNAKRGSTWVCNFQEWFI